jgi:hypothetical protein
VAVDRGNQYGKAVVIKLSELPAGPGSGCSASAVVAMAAEQPFQRQLERVGTSPSEPGRHHLQRHWRIVRPSAAEGTDLHAHLKGVGRSARRLPSWLVVAFWRRDLGLYVRRVTPVPHGATGRADECWDSCWDGRHLDLGRSL